jgi:hypothetical protein
VRHTISFREEGRPDVVITTSGTASLQGMNAYVDEIESDLRWRQGGTVLVDHRLADFSEITTADIRARGKRLAGTRPRLKPSRVAIVVTGRAAFGVMRMVDMFADDATERRVFYGVEEAYSWLAEPGLDTVAHMLNARTA